MKTIKNVIFVFVTFVNVCFFGACSQDVSVQDSQTETNISERLDSLDAVYGISRWIPSKHYASNEDNTELKQDNSLQIVSKDVDGFLDGASVGIAAGALVAIVSRTAGVAIGLSSGAILGITDAVIQSLAEAERLGGTNDGSGGNGNDGDGNNGEDGGNNGGEGVQKDVSNIYMLDFRDPIFGISFLIDENIECANYGYYHNFIISNLYQNNGKEVFGWDMETITDSVIEQVTQLFRIQDQGNVSSLLQNYRSFFLEEKSSSKIFENEYIARYIENISVIPNQSIEYTIEYMKIVQQECSEEEQLIVNGAISTYLYSSNLWKSYFPSVNDGVYICYNNHPFILSGVDSSETLNLLLCANDLSFVGVPVAINGHVEAICVFDELLGLNESSWGDCLHNDGENWYITIDEDISLISGDYNLYMRHGTYVFQEWCGCHVIFL